MSFMSRAINLVTDERHSQDRKWGVQNHVPERWLMILAEEVGEANKAWLEGDAEKYFSECVQVAAVAVAMVECMLRDKWRDTFLPTARK